ncbi:inositol monophosphatase family protein [Actinomadura barringtoniae]|uniref:inositol monophosphatase family protein n=1 Tax=Actinomadura barringtoniae TaxID=1427535 RepID=UPI002442A5F9|nr:inositol monophosphatase family protein [Actinomadura barringtoniae]
MDDLEFALALADRADEITLGHFARTGDLTVQSKPDRSLVTEADTATEQALRADIRRAHPTDAVLGEEQGSSPSASHRRWIIDPVDHTNNFVRGHPVYATLIALEEDAEITVGVVSAPALGRRWWAARGQGAYADGERIAVSRVSALSDAHVSIAALHRWNRRGLVPAITEIATTALYEWGSGGFWARCSSPKGAWTSRSTPGARSGTWPPPR